MKSAWNVLALVLLLPVAGQAQWAPLTTGARVRVTSPTDDLRRHVTIVTEVRGDSIVLAGRTGLRTIALNDVTALDVSTGTRTQVMRFAVTGLGAGAILGGILGAATYEGPDFIVGSAAEAGALFGVFFGGIGMVAGGVVGAMSRTDRWQPAGVPVRAAITPSSSGGISLTFSRAF